MHIKSNFIKILTMFQILLLIFTIQPTYCDDIEPNQESLDIAEEIEKNIALQTSNSIGNNTLTLNSRYCVVLDRTSKKVLFGKNENTKAKMASTTKILTAIIVLEKKQLSKTIEVSKKAANTGGSRLGLKTGDKITIRDLLFGLLLCSGNDEAVA